MKIPPIPQGVLWSDGQVLEPEHFERTDRRSARLAYLGALAGDPWPWGFTKVRIDEVALAAARLRIDCEGIFPGGEPLAARGLTHALVHEEGGPRELAFDVVRDPDDGTVSLAPGEGAAAEGRLPVARITFDAGMWATRPDWSAPALLFEPEHPLHTDMNQQLGALAALGAGFMTTLRVPGAEERPVARTLERVAARLFEGVGVMEALLAAPAVTPGRLGLEALRLALGVRAAIGRPEPIDMAWNPSDQRGAMRRLLGVAREAAEGIGLPFRATAFRRENESGMLEAAEIPAQPVLLTIEAARPADLIAARRWLEGAALAAPGRIEEALTRRVGGAPRRPIERDVALGISAGPLLALYRVDDDAAWRGGETTLALAARNDPPAHTSFAILVAEDTARQGERSDGGRWGGTPWDAGDRGRS